MSRERHFDIAIIGGGTGGCAAALAAAAAGKRVVMTEETAWIGGQFTSQAVPADEHRWIEQFGCTQGYRRFRNGLRDYYRRHFPLTAEASANSRLNPGNAIVSRVAVEPRTALAVFQEMLAPYIHSGKLTILTGHKAKSAQSIGDQVTSVTVEESVSGDQTVLTASYFLDATECGDLLPLAGAEYVTGAESQSQTGEPHALQGPAEPLDIQGITYCFALEYRNGETHPIDKPQDYEFWRQYKADFWPGMQLSWVAPHSEYVDGYSFFPKPSYFSLWNYRRVIDKANFLPGAFDGDISLINWPQNDYWLGPVYEVPEADRQKHLNQSKQLSLSVLYWLQTEAPRDDGGYGYPELRLRPDVVGTEDGLAMYPYIRESRRIQAEFTVLEQHISPDVRGEHGAEQFYDSVGVGCYRIDLHPSTGGRLGFYIPSFPFQIPLGSLIPVRVENLLPACKNIGVTHVTNGCYRLHPVEWNIGEAAGHLAAFCVDRKVTPRQVRNDSALLQEFQQRLLDSGVELEWPVVGAV